MDVAIDEHCGGSIGVIGIRLKHLAPKSCQGAGDVSLGLVFDHQGQRQAVPFLKRYGTRLDCLGGEFAWLIGQNENSQPGALGLR